MACRQTFCCVATDGAEAIHHPMRRGGRVVECGGLENRFTGIPGDEGSNPSSSARVKIQPTHVFQHVRDPLVRKRGSNPRGVDSPADCSQRSAKRDAHGCERRRAAVNPSSSTNLNPHFPSVLRAPHERRRHIPQTEEGRCILAAKGYYVPITATCYPGGKAVS